MKLAMKLKEKFSKTRKFESSVPVYPLDMMKVCHFGQNFAENSPKNGFALRDLLF